MPITIALSPEDEERLRAAASAAGIVAEELAASLVRDSLDLLPPRRRVSARGKYAHLSGATEEFMRSKREELEREEALWARRNGRRSS